MVTSMRLNFVCIFLWLIFLLCYKEKERNSINSHLDYHFSWSLSNFYTLYGLIEYVVNVRILLVTN
jgi:hypothetical protein